jgi:hypothetical protein
MNVKKILAITIIVLAVISCLSVASAGLFDSKEKAPAAPQPKTINLNKTDASFNVDQSIVQEAGNRMQISRDTGTASPSGDTKVNANISFTVTSDISSLNESEKKALEEMQNGSHSVDVKFDSNATKDMNFNNAKITIEGSTLTVTGSTQQHRVLSATLPPSDITISKLTAKDNNTILQIS